MSAKYQTYEQPLNERIRMCLRVETLMKRFGYFEALKGDWRARVDRSMSCGGFRWENHHRRLLSRPTDPIRNDGRQIF